MATSEPGRAGDPLRQLLQSEHRGVLATLQPDGRPHLSTLDFTADLTGGRELIRISSLGDRVKVRNLRRDPRAALHVTTGGGSAWAVAEGTAEVTDVAADPHDAVVAELIEVYRKIAGEHPDWDDYRAAMVADGRVVIRLRVDRVYGWAAPA